MGQESEEATVKEKIIKLLERDYTRHQLINDFGYNENTVDKAVKEFKERFGREPAKERKSARSGEQKALMTIGSKDMIPPEAVLEVIHLPADGQDVQVWRQGVMDGVGLLILGARFSQLCGAGQAEVVKSQLDIMREAKEGTKEIAEQAAYGAAMGVARQLSPELQSLKSAVSGQSGDPFARMVSMMQSAQTMMQMFGMPMGMMGAPGQPPPGQQPWQPPPIKRYSIKEIEEE